MEHVQQRNSKVRQAATVACTCIPRALGFFQGCRRKEEMMNKMHIISHDRTIADLESLAHNQQWKQAT